MHRYKIVNKSLNAHIKFSEHPLRFTCYCPESKIRTCGGQITLSKFDKICPLAIPKQISTISMHIPSFMKIHRYLLNLSSGNGNMDVSRADNSVKN